MRKLITGSAVALILVSVPASAGINLGKIGDLAKTVLNGNSVLQKANQNCTTPNSGFTALTPKETGILDVAVAAVKKAVPQSQFLALDNASQQTATTAAQTPTFCQQTQTQKKGLLAKIGDAGKKLLASKVLGIPGL